MKKILLLLTTMTCFASAQANTLYRHIPFNVDVKSGDELVVDYDFAEKDGIDCTTEAPAIKNVNTSVHDSLPAPTRLIDRIRF